MLERPPPLILRGLEGARATIYAAFLFRNAGFDPDGLLNVTLDLRGVKARCFGVV